jgi:hypothetical protein
MRVDRSDHPLLQLNNGGHAEQPPLLEAKWRRKLRRRPLAVRRRPRRSGKPQGVFSRTPPFFVQARRRSVPRTAASTRGHPAAVTRARRQLTGAGADDPLAHPHGRKGGFAWPRKQPRAARRRQPPRSGNTRDRSAWGAKVCAPVFLYAATARRPTRARAGPRPTAAAARRPPSRR